MQSIQNILRTFIKDHGLEGGVVLNTIRKKWPDIVGQTIAIHTSPDMIRGKVITLIVDTPQWMHHLTFFREEITAKLRQYNVSEVRFRLGRLPETAPEASAAEESQLTTDDLTYLENTLKRLDDAELREKFRRLIVHGLTRKRK